MTRSKALQACLSSGPCSAHSRAVRDQGGAPAEAGRRLIERGG
jgi:hypothetical protein